MNTIIRKISVGREYPDGAIHYQVGTFPKLKGKKYEITQILLDRELLQMGKLAYNVYVKNVKESSSDIVNEYLWKQVVDEPCVVENDLDFE